MAISPGSSTSEYLVVIIKCKVTLVIFVALKRLVLIGLRAQFYIESLTRSSVKQQNAWEKTSSCHRASAWRGLGGRRRPVAREMRKEVGGRHRNWLYRALYGALRALCWLSQAVEIHQHIFFFKQGSMFILKFEKEYWGNRCRYDKMSPAEENGQTEDINSRDSKDVNTIGICHQLDVQRELQSSGTHNFEFFPSEPWNRLLQVKSSHFIQSYSGPQACQLWREGI